MLVCCWWITVWITLLSIFLSGPQTRCFVDHRRVKLMAGSGGRGVSSFHSEPRKEWGGPDGGNGGDGGSIIMKGKFGVWFQAQDTIIFAMYSLQLSHSVSRQHIHYFTIQDYPLCWLEHCSNHCYHQRYLTHKAWSILHHAQTCFCH